MHDSWRDQILGEFTHESTRLYLVADPDGLLVEEEILQRLTSQGFDLVTFSDPIAFRYLYESRYRESWTQGEGKTLIVRSEAEHLDLFPYDLLQVGRYLSLDLMQLFPNLSYPIVATLDLSCLDALYHAQRVSPPTVLGDVGTKEYLLHHVFEIVPSLVKEPADLLKILLRRHYRDIQIPDVLDRHFIDILRHQGSLDEWPLEEIVRDRQAFFVFLQERWPLFVERMASPEPDALRERALSSTFKFTGPAMLPFEHDDVRVYVDNLFLDGILKPVEHKHGALLADSWAAIGIKTDPKADQLLRLRRLLPSIGDTIPAPDAKHQEWLTFAYRWAEHIALRVELQNSLDSPMLNELGKLQKRVDVAFLTWIKRRYAGLHNLPAMPPVMVHHVPGVLSRKVTKNNAHKAALIVIDGLALDQWLILREALRSQRPNLDIQEGAVFAWLPTLTPVSRQALFAGRPPFYFPASIKSTSEELAQWRHYWHNLGFTPSEVGYIRGLGEGDLGEVREVVTGHGLRIIGLVINTVDKIMHGMELGTAGMHNQVRQWVAEGYLVRLCDLLIESGFEIVLTSDHGNIEAYGCGQPSEGVLADVRGNRVRIYPDSSLRNRTRDSFPDAIAWPAVGLPDGYLPLLAPERLAFVPKGQRVVAHGGASIEEVIVPFVTIRRS